MTPISKPSTTVRQNLRAEVEHERTRRGGKELAEFLALLSDEERSEWLEVLADDQVQTAQIHRVLKKRGLVVAYSTVARYRERLRSN